MAVAKVFLLGAAGAVRTYGAAVHVRPGSGPRLRATSRGPAVHRTHVVLALSV